VPHPGLQPEELLGHDTRFLYPTERNTAGGANVRPAKKEERGQSRNALHTKDGRIIYVDMGAVCLRRGTLRRVSPLPSWTSPNASRPKRAWPKKSPAGASYLNRLRGHPDHRPETARFLEFNTTAHEQLGYLREEFAGLGIRDVEAVKRRSRRVPH